MKVICIKQGEWTDGISRAPGNHPCYGEIVTVTRECVKSGLEVYILVEYPHRAGYVKDRFIPLSDIDETEMVREKQEVLA